MVLPAPPYTYDDARLTYDEQCFFYDGGYDSVCLAGPATVFVPRGGGGRSNRRKNLPYLNIFVKSRVLKINEEKYPSDDLEGWVRFSGEDEPMTIFLNGVKVKQKAPFADGYLKDIVNSANLVDSVNMSMKFLNDLAKGETPSVVIEPETSKNPNIDVKIVEPYKEISVVCELIPINVQVSEKPPKANN